MELSISGQRRRAAQTASPQTGKTSPESAGTGAGRAFRRQNRTDRLTLSRNALAALEELNRQDREAQRKLLEARQKGNGELDALTKSLKVAEKCRKIAARIQAGDKVPPEDLKYLMDNDSASYKLALVNRKPKEHPKEWDSVLDEEDRETGGLSGESAAPAADPGGGDSVE